MNLKIVFSLLIVILNLLFMMNAAPMNNNSESRKKRGLPAGLALSPGFVSGALTALKAGGKMLMWTTIFTSSAVAGHVITKKIDEKDDEEFLERIKLNCRTNHYGCASNFCWVTCGPRLKSNDWCVAAPSSNAINNNKETIADKNNNNTVFVVSCKTDSDCDPCFKCAGSCMLGSDAYLNADGSVMNHD